LQFGSVLFGWLPFCLSVFSLHVSDFCLLRYTLATLLVVLGYTLALLSTSCSLTRWVDQSYSHTLLFLYIKLNSRFFATFLTFKISESDNF
jgi:hypothetical protein